MTKEDIIKPENLVAKKPTLMNDNPMHYCPGCSHGVVHKLVAEVIEEMGLEDKAIGISPVGCAVFIYRHRLAGSRPWTCARTCHCHQAPLARPPGVHLPRRRRPGLYRYCRNHPRLEPRRKHHHHLHQQCHLWYDRGTNGSHYPCRHEDIDQPLRT